MAVNINADTTTGLELTSDTSGNINIQNDGTTVVAVTAPGVAVTGALSTTGNITVPSGNISAPAGTITATSFVGSGASLTGIAGGFSNMEVFTSPGTWTNPGSITKVKVTIVGGGGGSGGGYSVPTGDKYSSGGAGGGAAIEVIPFPSATNVPVTVGPGGPAGGVNTSGGTGGTTSFGAYCSATGGGGGIIAPTANTSLAGGTGGTGSGGTLNIQGQNGGTKTVANGSLSFGGSSLLGFGGQAALSPAPGQGQSGNGYGAGASSAVPGPSSAGVAGTAGVVIVEY